MRSEVHRETRRSWELARDCVPTGERSTAPSMSEPRATCHAEPGDRYRKTVKPRFHPQRSDVCAKEHRFSRLEDTMEGRRESSPTRSHRGAVPWPFRSGFHVHLWASAAHRHGVCASTAPPAQGSHFNRLLPDASPGVGDCLAERPFLGPLPRTPRESLAFPRFPTRRGLARDGSPHRPDPRRETVRRQRVATGSGPSLVDEQEAEFERLRDGRERLDGPSAR
jgi:hypothetical protein